MIKRIRGFILYIVNRKQNEVERKEEDKQYEHALMDVARMRNKLSASSVAKNRYEKTCEKLKKQNNMLVLKVAELERDNHLLELSRNRYLSNCKNKTKKIKELQKRIEDFENGTRSV